MYDRAQRNIVWALGSTPVNVGPGSYDGCGPAALQTKGDGYAPFLSMTCRDTNLNITDQVLAIPGPGHYDPQLPQEQIKGGKTLSNRALRFKPTVSEIPGPGTYQMDKFTSIRPVKSAPEPQATKGALITSRIRYHRRPEAPSIPTMAQAYGYEECEDGTLKKQDPPTRDGTMGPAYYKPAFEENTVTKAYKGCHFSKMTGPRGDIKGKLGPGPGDYDPYKEMSTQVENANIHGEYRARFEARIPHYHELIERETQKRGTPAPGKYDIPGLFQPPPPKLNTDGIMVEHPPFLTQSKRFIPLKISGPSPGSYNDPRTAFESMRRVTGLKRSPFGQTSVRFQLEGYRKAPAPGSYNVSGMGAESLRKAYLESTRRGAFGTTAARTTTVTSKDVAAQPGPSHYQIKEKVHQSRYQQLSSNFASESTRMHEVPTDIKELPPPGSYNVVESFEKSQGRSRYAQPRSQAAKRKNCSFLSAASRFASTGDVVPGIHDSEIPGPGAYNPSLPKQHLPGVFTAKDNRFKPMQSDTPAPNTYEFSPLVQDSVLIGTFNTTLTNPALPVMDSSIPNPTSKQHAFLMGV